MPHWPTPRQMPVSLRRLFPQASFVGCADIRVSAATEDSRRCTTGSLFAAIAGKRVEGAHCVPDAIRRGATSLLVERPLPDASVPQCVVPNVREAYSRLCSELMGCPSLRLHVSGVTGTNGKTTVTWLLRSIFQAAGKRAGVLGTIEYSDGIDRVPAGLTTPDSATLSCWLGQMVRAGTTHAAIELSSHALHQDRCAGTLLDAAVVTNVTHDHYDYHGGFEAYLASKARILDHCKKGAAVVLNADASAVMRLLSRIPDSARLVTYGLENRADLSATILAEDRSGTRFLLHLGQTTEMVCSPLVGRHNVSNCLAAAAVAQSAGISASSIVKGIEALCCVPGRLERIEGGQPFAVFVDYAHTEDALRRSIDCLKRLTAGRLICVFGAGGDRDRTKRPLLGKAAQQADLAVITSDNPRSEDPCRIVDDILAGFATPHDEHRAATLPHRHASPGRSSRSASAPHVELDRAEAIRWALRQAGPDDCVLIAGKGHEREQIVGTERRPFDDREVARQALQELSASRTVVEIGAYV